MQHSRMYAIVVSKDEEKINKHGAVYYLFKTTLSERYLEQFITSTVAFIISMCIA